MTFSFMYHTFDKFLKTSYFHHIYYWIAHIVHCHLMWVVGAFMTFNVNFYDVEKY